MARRRLWRGTPLPCSPHVSADANGPSDFGKNLNGRLLLRPDLFTAIADERQVDFVAAGSTPFRREDLECGFEPDSCFYIRHADAMRDRDEVDLSRDPPPDLVIEIDITSPSLPRFPVFAAVGVLEVWRCDGARVEIFRLASGSYIVSEESVTLPGVTGDVLTSFMRAAETGRRADWLRQVRVWASGRG